MKRKDKIELIELVEEQQKRKAENKFLDYFPDEGDLSRDKYPKQVQFFKAGKDFNERAFIAGNRTGKTFSGAYEMTCHLTGIYPDWWEGKRFKDAVKAWAAAPTNEMTRDIVQHELLGLRGHYGTGMLPKSRIKRTTVRPGIPDAVQDVFVEHVSGGISQITFKSYVQGREAFQGTTCHVIWLDEEPQDSGIYSECLTRTLTVGGVVYCTFTPLLGLSDVVMSFLPDGKCPENGIVPTQGLTH